jgi:branched-chain amino acid transport system substrate-binding protein
MRVGIFPWINSVRLSADQLKIKKEVFMFQRGLNRSRHIFVSLALVISLGFALPGAAPAAGDKNVVLASNVGLTGSTSAWGIRADRGIAMMVEIINSQEGIKSLGGAKIHYIPGDNESKADIAGVIAEKAVGQGASAIIGCTGSAMALVASQIAERNNVVFIDSFDYDPLITARGFKYVFRTIPIMKDIVTQLLIYADTMNKVHGTNFKKVGILCEDSITGDTSAKALEERTKELGLDLVESVKYNAKTTKDFSGVLSKFKAKGVEILVGHNQPADAIQIVRNCKEINFNPALLGGSGGWLAPEFTKNLEDLANGCVYAAVQPPGSTSGKIGEISKEYKAKYNEEISSTVYGGITAAWLFYQAVEKAASKDPVAIAKALRQLDLNFGEGYYFQLTGAKFGENGDNLKAASLISQYQNREATTVFPASFEEKKPIWPKPKF